MERHHLETAVDSQPGRCHRQHTPLLNRFFTDDITAHGQGGTTTRQRNLRHLFTTGAHAATSGPFVLMKFPDAPDLSVVYLEGQTGGIYLESTEDVAR